MNVGTQDDADNQVPGPTKIIGKSKGAFAFVAGNPAPALTPMSDNTITPAGGDQPHNNLMPYLTVYFNIALQGVFPPRT